MTNTAIRRNWINRNRWYLARRTSQLVLLAVFLVGPLFGWWIVKGNLASSRLLNSVSLSDPLIAIQSFAANHDVAPAGVIGAVTIALLYALLGGRLYCSWVCPINIVSDAAQWSRNKIGYHRSWNLPKNIRYYLLAALPVLSYMTGSIIWELVNPITMVHRALVYGIGTAWLVVVLVFLFDFLVVRRGWCGSICPVGAFYAVIGRWSRLRVSARNRDACTDCGDCFSVCPEPQIIAPALYGNRPIEKVGLDCASANSPLIDNPECTLCGACVDVCNDAVFVPIWRSIGDDLTP